MALDRFGFVNLRQDDGSYIELTLSNFGYETITDFNNIELDRNYWFKANQGALNRPPTEAWYWTGVNINFQEPTSNHYHYVKQIAFSVGLSNHIYLRSYNEATKKWTKWERLMTNVDMGKTLEEDTPVTIPEIQ